jgi:hypothetical protein
VPPSFSIDVSIAVSIVLRARSTSASDGPVSRSAFSSSSIAASSSDGSWPGRAVASTMKVDVSALEFCAAAASCAIWRS